MPKQPAPLRPGEPPQPKRPGPDLPPMNDPPESPEPEPVESPDRDPTEPTRDSVQPVARQNPAARAAHFSLPTPPAIDAPLRVREKPA
jgi:hypothetical protein